MWHEHGFYIFDECLDVHAEAENFKLRVTDFLRGEAVAQPAPSGGLASSPGDPDEPIRYSEKQREFLRALNQFVSKGIQLDYRISQFRRDVLGDPERTISHIEATQFVKSEAVQRLPLTFFEEEDIPLIGHVAERPPRKEKLQIEPGLVSVDVRDIPFRPQAFRWITPNQVLRKYDVATNSVLESLDKLCKYLAEKHPITEELAAYLVLCGGLVNVPGIIGNNKTRWNQAAGSYTYDHNTITLTVQSWVTPEQVRKAYARLRQQNIIASTYRSKSNRNIAVFEFVMERALLSPPEEPVPGTPGCFQVSTLALDGGRMERAVFPLDTGSIKKAARRRRSFANPSQKDIRM